jgi:hypothetical protein
MARAFQQQLSAANPLRFELSQAAHPTVSYPLQDTTKTYSKGTPVKLLSTGAVGIVTATADVVFGYVFIQNNLTNQDTNVSGRATILECALDHVYGLANGTVAVGDLVSASGTVLSAAVPGVPAVTSYKKAVSGEHACGIAIDGGATTTPVEIAFFPAPVLIP